MRRERKSAIFVARERASDRARDSKTKFFSQAPPSQEATPWHVDSSCCCHCCCRSAAALLPLLTLLPLLPRAAATLSSVAQHGAIAVLSGHDRRSQGAIRSLPGAGRWKVSDPALVGGRRRAAERPRPRRRVNEATTRRSASGRRARRPRRAWRRTHEVSTASGVPARRRQRRAAAAVAATRTREKERVGRASGSRRDADREHWLVSDI